MSYVGPVTRQLIDNCTKELGKTETRDKIIKNIIDPIMNGLFKKYLSYIACFIIMQIMIIILLIFIICKVY